MLSADWMQFVPLILIGIVFYFFLIRPQQKKAQQHREMLGALRRGDKIVTNGGLIGTITKIVNEREVQLEISENVRVRVIRGMITDVLAKTEPQAEDSVSEEDTAAAPKATEAKKTLGTKKFISPKKKS